MPTGRGANKLSNEGIRELRQMRKLVLGHEEAIGKITTASSRGPQWYWGKIATTMTAGTLAVPTSFTWNAWLPDPASTSNPVPFIVATESTLLGIPGVNRSSMTGVSGTMVKMEFASGEWSPAWVECPE